VKRIAWIIALGLLSGCSLTYTEIGIPVPETDGLEIGRSTKPDVLEALGPPRLVRRQFDGELYTWRRTKDRQRSITILPVYVKAFFFSDGESRRDELSLLFDREGVLRGIGRRLETEEGGD
jgi:outer membrane protein assembly factor BamE (lipoprotein component of BamABCDE complex)